MESEEKLLSIVVLDISHHYLLPITLESIFNQKEKNFDLTVIVQNILPKELTYLRTFSDRLKVIGIGPELEFSGIKNRALELTNGKYVHFLFPGEYYLSNFSLSYAFDKMERKNYPDIICFSNLFRSTVSPPKIAHASFSKSFLGGERFPLFSRNVFFLKKAIVEAGGFDQRYRGLEGFDAITKIHLRPKSRTLCCRRIVVDFEPQKHIPKMILGHVSDLVMIIYRHYGFWTLFRLGVIKEMMDFAKHWLKGIKRYFMQGES